MMMPTMDIIIYALSYIAVSIIAIVPSITNYVDLFVLAVLLYAAYKDDLVCMTPMFLFFNSTILYYNGVAISDVLFAVFIVNEVLRRPRIDKKNLHIVFLFFIIYAVVVVSDFNVMLSVEITLIYIFVIFLLQNVYDENNWKKFTVWYLVGLFSASLYGLVSWTNNISSGVTRRFMLAFTDPNYAGMFLSIGLYIVLFSDAKNGLLKKLLLIAIVSEILITMSSTAILCNLILIMILMIDNLIKVIKQRSQKISTNQLLGYAAAFAVIIAAIICIQKANNSIMADSINRFVQKITGMNAGLSESTTGRSDVWAKHLKIFEEKSGILKKLFGGFFITDRGVDPRYFTIVSHEVYVDSLLCFGVIGTMIYVLTILKQLISKWTLRSVSNEHKQIFCIVVIWLIYSFGLSMFPFWGFSFMLFVTIRDERSIELR